MLSNILINMSLIYKLQIKMTSSYFVIHCILNRLGSMRRAGVCPTIHCTSPWLGRGIDIMRARPAVGMTRFQNMDNTFKM